MYPDDLCSVASKLALGDNCAYWRSSASRAYYSLYAAVMILFSELELRPNQRNAVHDKWQQVLADCGDEEVEVVADMMHDLLQIRKHSDYNFNSEVIKSREDAKVHVLKAHEAIKILKGILADPNRLQAIRPGILKGFTMQGIQAS
jgi:hypothetical protein